RWAARRTRHWRSAAARAWAMSWTARSVQLQAARHVEHQWLARRALEMQQSRRRRRRQRLVGQTAVDALRQAHEIVLAPADHVSDRLLGSLPEMKLPMQPAQVFAAVLPQS